jgi:hypothetical protein
MDWTLVFYVAFVTLAASTGYYLGRSSGYKHGHFRGVKDENRRMRAVAVGRDTQ